MTNPWEKVLEDKFKQGPYASFGETLQRQLNDAWADGLRTGGHVVTDYWQERIKPLVEALEFYESTWDEVYHPTHVNRGISYRCSFELEADAGTKARQALEQYRKENPED